MNCKNISLILGFKKKKYYFSPPPQMPSSFVKKKSEKSADARIYLYKAECSLSLDTLMSSPYIASPDNPSVFFPWEEWEGPIIFPSHSDNAAAGKKLGGILSCRE